jgi:hypothetical protein
VGGFVNGERENQDEKRDEDGREVGVGEQAASVLETGRCSPARRGDARARRRQWRVRVQWELARAARYASKSVKPKRRARLNAL